MKTAIKVIVLVLSTFFLSSKTIAQCHIDDWTALKALYESTDGDNWTNNTGWEEVVGNAPTASCNLEDLYGVFLNTNGRVTCLDLDREDNTFCGWSGNGAGGNNLNGLIPEEIDKLQWLVYLFFQDNRLSGDIPKEIGNFSRLISLHLESNELLSGNIPPELSNLNNLESLNLSSNQFSGSIPSEFENLYSLTHLNLSFNELSGSIPPELGNLSNLEILNLSSNLIGGSIPPVIGNLNNLEYLNLNTNQLIGSIPHQFGNLYNLTTMNLSYNFIEDSIPWQIGNLNNLTYLNLAHNILSGSIPPELGNLYSLTSLLFYENRLDGSIPPEIGNLDNLFDLWLNKNQFNGSIPPELGNLTNLRDLYLDNNQLNNSIPSELGNLSNLMKLYLHKNQLNGSIPQEMGNLSNLTMFQINNNNLSGCYPSNIIPFCPQLIHQFFDGNPDINEGNNFNATWEDFCTTGAGVCIDEPFCGCTDPTACNYNPTATCDNGSCLQSCTENAVYPGDLNHDGTVNGQDVALSGLFLYNAGIAREQEHQNIDWYPHPSQDWGLENTQHIDLKHHDCNGDGLIDETDTLAVSNNYGLTWKTPEPTPPPPQETDYQVMLQPTEQIYDGNLVMNVVLERREGEDLTLQGGYFTVDYSDIEGDFSYVDLAFLPISWLGTPNNNLWYESTHFPTEKKIEVGFTKTNNFDSEGSGIIGQLILEYDTGIAKRANVSYNFEVNTIGVHQNNGNFIPIEDQLLQINLNSTCQPNWSIDEETPFQNLYQSNSNITTNGFVLIGEDQEVEYSADRVRINSGFSAKAGAEFKVRSSGCN